LFGTLSQIHFSNDTYEPQGSGRAMLNVSFNLTIAAEFSLINTRTYEIIASFSAVGDGSDTTPIAAQYCTFKKACFPCCHQGSSHFLFVQFQGEKGVKYSQLVLLQHPIGQE